MSVEETGGIASLAGRAEKAQFTRLATIGLTSCDVQLKTPKGILRTVSRHEAGIADVNLVTALSRV